MNPPPNPPLPGGPPPHPDPRAGQAPPAPVSGAHPGGTAGRHPTESLAPVPAASEILVVDDEEFNRDMLGRRLQRAGFQIRTAVDGRAALAAVGERLPAAVLLDVMMPDLDGLAVLRELRRHYSSHLLPIVMVTARDTGEQIVEALQAGANDYVTKPVDLPVLLARLRTHLALRAAHLSLAERDRKTRTDLEIARRVHRRLFPAALPAISGFSLGFGFAPAAAVGGDFFDLVPAPQGGTGLFFGDISGHGVAGALLTALLKTLLQNACREEPNPAAALRRLNDRISDEFPEGFFVSGLHLTVYPGRPDIHLVSACPDPGLLVRADGSWQALPQGAPFLGMFPSDALPDGDFPASTVALASGDRLVVVTDGLLEVRDPAGRPLTLSGLGDLCGQLVHLPAPAFVEALLARIAEFAGPAGSEDDLMALVVRCDGDPTGGTP